nr:MAG TPA: hypothetical protein [Caudoviricetes sp.]
MPRLANHPDRAFSIAAGPAAFSSGRLRIVSNRV